MAALQPVLHAPPGVQGSGDPWLCSTAASLPWRLPIPVTWVERLPSSVGMSRICVRTHPVPFPKQCLESIRACLKKTSRQSLCLLDTQIHTNQKKPPQKAGPGLIHSKPQAAQS